MKKFYVIVIMMLFSGYLIAQSINKIEKKENPGIKYLKEINAKSLNQKIVKINDYSPKKSKFTTGSRWYNYGSAVNSINFPNGGNLLNIGRLFPDTTVKIQYTDGIAPPWIHSAAIVLDPVAAVFESMEELNLNKASLIKVDSLEILAYYRRHIQNPDEVDTLIIEVLQDVRWYNYFTGMEANYGSDTLRFCFLSYDDNMDYKDPGPDYVTPITKFKIPLTAQSEADTTDNGLNVIRFAVPGTDFTAMHRGVAATIKFKPGYTWTPNVSLLNKDLNEFSILSYEESGNKDGPTFPMYWPGEWNTSYTVPSWGLFDTESNWYQNYVPSWAYVIGYVMENHFVSFHITTTNDGISENSEKNIKLAQNVPNPAANSTVISYESKQVADVNLVITDLTGKKVMEINEGKQTTGTHKITINTNNLKNGMYYYTLNVDNNSLTRKMIINK